MTKSYLTFAAFAVTIALAAPANASIGSGQTELSASKAILAASSTLPMMQMARRGADDPAGHNRHGHGKDDPVGHASSTTIDPFFQTARRGADDPAGHNRHGRGKDDPAGHASITTIDPFLQMARHGRGKDDPVHG